MKKNIFLSQNLYWNLYLFLFISITLCFYGCRSIYNPATGKKESIFIPGHDNDEEKYGRNISKSVEKKFQSVDNWHLQVKIQNIGQKIAAVSDRKEINYHFEILDHKEVNAFALPGGYIYVFKGLIEETESDDEIAAILAHEIGHIAAKHHAKRTKGSIGLNTLMMVLANIKSDSASKTQAYEALKELMLQYSRKDELEADRLAVKYLRRADYNPKAMITFLEILKKIKYEKPIQRARAWKTHPYIADRIKAVKEEIGASIDFEDYINAGMAER